MANMLDLDQLRTFVAIADSGSFTKAADSVHKTQSAVSMQMRRLEERIGKPIFGRDGRSAKLTEQGERLLGYARRMVRLSDETIAAFDDEELSGRVRLGTPDDYADRFLPEILARFSRSNPRVEVTVVCEPTVQLIEALRAGELDLGIITNTKETPTAEIVRQEPLLWVASGHHRLEEEEVLPLALGRDTCCWRRTALEALERDQPQIPPALCEQQFDRAFGGRARRPCHLGAAGIGAAAGHAGSQRGRRLPAPRALRNRTSSRPEPPDQCDRRRAGRAHRLLARQSLDAGGGGVTAPGRIVVLNGAPRSGKSSIVAALQADPGGTWINLGVDMHMERMLPKRLLPGIGLRPGGERPDLEPLLSVLFAALYESIAAHSRLGLDVVADVGHHDLYAQPLGILADAARRLAGLPAMLVGVRCPLDIIMQRRRSDASGRNYVAIREQATTFRLPVRLWQGEVHRPGHLRSSKSTPPSCLCGRACAAAILARFELGIPLPLPPSSGLAALGR